MDTGQKVWTHKYAKSPNWGSMLATAGGLVFSGGTNDRKFHAFDATTGKLLWEFPAYSGFWLRRHHFRLMESNISRSSLVGAGIRAEIRVASTVFSRANFRRFQRAGKSWFLLPG